jgi:antitoxin (DNA-binding transcriptional repressor) of toxin-antitoxin stability system
MMTTTVTLEEAAANLGKLINGLAHGDEVIITKDQQVVAKLTAESRPKPPRPEPGFGKGSILYISPDFDAPMEEFKEYME